MKVLLTAINAKYIHSNLAVYSLKANCGSYEPQVKLMEYSINQYPEEIFQSLYREKADVVCFSCYWNCKSGGRVAEAGGAGHTDMAWRTGGFLRCG